MVNWYAITITAAILYLLPKKYLVRKMLEYYKSRPVKPRQKTVIVVLDNIGMNFEKARRHALSGCSLIIAARDGDRAEVAKKDLTQMTKNKKITTMQLDAADPNSMTAFAKQIAETERNVDVIINDEGFELSELEINFSKQQLALERFHTHCLQFLLQTTDVQNYKLQGWYQTVATS